MRCLRVLPMIQLMPAASSRRSPDTTSPGGGPGKNERPHSIAGNTPSATDRAPVEGEGRCAGIPVRIVHLSPPRRHLLESG
jgi:hypothetical protein